MVIIDPHWNLEDSNTPFLKSNTYVIIDPHWNLEVPAPEVAPVSIA